MRRPSIGSPTASRVDYLVCPVCGRGRLRPGGLLSRMAECDFCECAFDHTIVGMLKQIVALPEALGKHPCECGHPEMCCLPDEVFHCPACRSEMLPFPSLNLLDRLRRGDGWQHASESRAPARAHQTKKGLGGWRAAAVAMVVVGRTLAWAWDVGCRCRSQSSNGLDV